MIVVQHGSALLAIWCAVARHDWIVMPDFMQPDDIRSELAEVTLCMRCGELRCTIRQRQLYR